VRYGSKESCTINSNKKEEETMSKGNFEVALPRPYLVGDILAKVYEIGGASPTNIVRVDQDWGVKVHWDLKGSLAPFICGEWCLHLRLESLGPGPEIVFNAKRRIPLNPCGRGRYDFDFRVRRGKIRADHCSIPYKPVVTITYYTACHKPGPIAGFVELPIMQFYDPGRGPIYGGNGRHATEVGEEEESELETVEMFEPEGVDTFEAEAVEMLETDDDGEEFEYEATGELEVESEKELG
jgi:hypothetical protein